MNHRVFKVFCFVDLLLSFIGMYTLFFIDSVLVFEVTKYNPVRLSRCLHCVTNRSLYMKNCECILGDPAFGRLR